MENSKLINGDSIDELKKLKDNSVDLLCTDPPYGYGFMGKSWDKMLPPKEIFEESLRVLKPGSFAFVMSAPRSDVQYRMVQMLEDVGFEIGYTPIYWTYATGFPKAMNIGKAVDKRLGKERKVVGKHPDPRHKYLNTDIRSGNAAGGGHTNAARESGLITAPASDEAKKLDGSYAGYQPKPAVEVVIVAMKPLEKKGYLDQALDNQKGITWLDNCRIPFAGMSDEEQFDKDNVAGHQKFIEKRKEEMYGGGWDKPARKSKSDYEKYVSDKNNKENFSDERGWNKWGEEDFGETRNAQNFTSEDTYERVSAFGDTEQSETKDGRNLWGKKATKKVKITKRKPREENTVFKTSGFKSENNDTAEASPLGRFAANLLVSDDVLNVKSKGQLAPTTGKEPSNYKENNTHGSYLGYRKEMTPRDDGDSFSRYYSLDAWWEDRVKKLPEEIQRTFPFLIVPKASKSEKNSGLENNIHPTVKPVTLMSYLVTLGSRKNDVVLDPFSGSGTTGIACVFSERNYILIEREKEYFEILKARIKKAENPAGLVENEWF